MAQNWRIDDREFTYVKDVLSGGFPGGSKTNYVGKLEAAFAEKFGVKYAITFCNGTATMHAALAAAGIGPGDEVIVPPLTMSSTTFAVIHAGATPVYADIDPATFVMDAEAARRCITPRTRAIMPVSLYGLAPDFAALRAICEEHKLVLIEDDAQCFLGECKGRLVGAWGDFASFSFQNSKHMTCGEGGMVVTDNLEYADKVRRFSSLGYGLVNAKPGASKITKEMLVKPDFDRHASIGYNYRVSNLTAAVAFAQLEKLDMFVAWRRKCAAAFAAAIDGISWLRPQAEPEGYRNSYWAYTVKIEDDRIPWLDFYNRFNANGGDGFYGAWKLSYQEPCLRELIPAEHRQCPVAEATQPRLMQFKTNYGDDETIARQAEALRKTALSF